MTIDIDMESGCGSCAQFGNGFTEFVRWDRDGESENPGVPCHYCGGSGRRPTAIGHQVLDLIRNNLHDLAPLIHKALTASATAGKEEG